MNFEQQLEAEVKICKSNKDKIKRAVTWLDAKKLKARRSIEIHHEQKRLMEMFEL